MTDYMSKARDMVLDALVHDALEIAHTLEALDTERAAHEATKAENEANLAEVFGYRTKWLEAADRADKAEAELQALREAAHGALLVLDGLPMSGVDAAKLTNTFRQTLTRKDA